MEGMFGYASQLGFVSLNLSLQLGLTYPIRLCLSGGSKAVYLEDQQPLICGSAAAYLEDQRPLIWINWK
jgi:hypothetical protein